MEYWAAKLADFDMQLHAQDSVSGHQDQRLDHSLIQSNGSHTTELYSSMGLMRDTYT